jgi:hypothetical protein
LTARPRLAGGSGGGRAIRQVTARSKQPVSSEEWGCRDVSRSETDDGGRSSAAAEGHSRARLAAVRNREAGYNYYRAYPQDATFDTTTNTSKLTVEIGAMGGDHSFGNFAATSFSNVDSNVKTIIAPNSGHYIPDENLAFVSECATLFFSASPPATAPTGYASCMP